MGEEKCGDFLAFYIILYDLFDLTKKQKKNKKKRKILNKRF